MICPACSGSRWVPLGKGLGTRSQPHSLSPTPARRGAWQAAEGARLSRESVARVCKEHAFPPCLFCALGTAVDILTLANSVGSSGSLLPSSPAAQIPSLAFASFFFFLSFQATFSFLHFFCSQPRCEEGLGVGRRASALQPLPAGRAAGEPARGCPASASRSILWSLTARHRGSILGARRQPEDTHPRPGHANGTSPRGRQGWPLPRGRPDLSLCRPGAR